MNENLEKVNENTPKDEEQNVVRNRSEKVVVEYRKPSFFMSLLLILIGACLATIVLLLVYIFKIKPANEAKPTTPTEQTEVVEEPQTEEVKVPDVDLSIDGEFVKSLKEKIPFSFYIVNNNYKPTKVTYSDLTDNERLTYTLYRMYLEKNYETIDINIVISKMQEYYYPNDADGQKFSLENVQKKYRELFGPEKELVKENVVFGMYAVDWVEEDNCFYGRSFTGGGGSPWSTDRRIDSAAKSEDGKEIYLYEYFIRSNPYSEGPYEIYNYTYEYGESIGTEYDKVDEYVNLGPEKSYTKIKDEIFEKYKDQLVKFKSTFKLDTNGNYYWVSTEPVV